MSQDYRLEPMRYFYSNENYDESAKLAMEIIKDKPKMSESPYITGYNSYKKLLKNSDNKKGICDTLVYIIKTRMENFGESTKLYTKLGRYLYFSYSDRINDSNLLEMREVYEKIPDKDNTNSFNYFMVITDLYDLKKVTIAEYDSIYQTINITNEKKKSLVEKYHSDRCSKNKKWLYLKFEKGDTIAGKSLCRIVTDIDSLIIIHEKMYEITKKEYHKESLCRLYYDKGKYKTALKYTTNNTHDVVGAIFYNQYFVTKDEFEQKLVMISAYEEYQKAGDTKNMALCKQYFPTIEEIFVRGYSKGDKKYVGGLINRNVTLRTR
jgi:hypothetical protein